MRERDQSWHVSKKSGPRALSAARDASSWSRIDKRVLQRIDAAELRQSFGGKAKPDSPLQVPILVADLLRCEGNARGLRLPSLHPPEHYLVSEQISHRFGL